MKKTYAVMIAVAIIGGISIWQIPNIKIEHLDSYLIASLIVVEILLLFVSRIFQIKDSQDMKKASHTKKLNEKIIKRLCTIHMMQNNGTYSLYVESIPEQDEKIYQKKTHDYLWNYNLHYDRKHAPIKWLSEPYMKWTLKHLEKYDFWKYWKQIDTLQKLNSTYEKYISDFQTILEKEMKKQFPDFIQFTHDEENKSFFVSYEIRQEVEHYIRLKGYDSEFNELNIEENTNGQRIITRCGYHDSKEPLLISNEEKKLDVDILKSLIKSISEKIEKQFSDYVEMKGSIDEAIIKFRKRLELLHEELETEDILIKGKCHGCS